MIILEKIIRKEWMKSLLISSSSLAFLIVIGNLISGFMRSNVSPYEVLINQMLIFPSTLLKVLPTACLISSLVTSNNLIKTNQLVAIYSTGVSPNDIIKKIFLLGTSVALAQFLIGGYLKPFSLNLKNKFVTNLDEKFRNLEADGLLSAKITNGKMWIKKNNQFVKYQSFNPSEQKINNVTIYTVNSKSVLKDFHKSKSISFNKSWRGEDNINTSSIDKKNSPLIKISKTTDVSFKVTTDNLKKFEQDITTLDIRKLIAYTNNLERSGLSGIKYKIIYLSIISSTINCLIFTLLGLGALYSPNKRSTSTGLIAGGSFVFVIVFWLVEGYLLEMGKSLKINPVLSTFGIQILLSGGLLLKLIKDKKSRFS